jgi:nucleotide-binding universal stress UspA family protein
MKNILVPTDFSDCAHEAVELGFEFAKKASAEIHFLHLVRTPVDWVKLPLEKEDFYPEIKEEIGLAKSKLSQLKRKAEKMGLVCQTFLVYDKGREEIDMHIEHHKHDFVIMGSHGAKGFKEFIGTNTQRVVRNSPVPVFIVKKRPEKFEIKNIVFASTFEEDVQGPFQKVVEFAELMKAKIHLLYVNVPYHFKETDESDNNMRTFLDKCPKGTCTINIYNALDEERGIQKFTESINADVIAITTHGKSGIMKMISPSITESLVNHSDIPIFSVNIKIK